MGVTFTAVIAELKYINKSSVVLATSHSNTNKLNRSEPTTNINAIQTGVQVLNLVGFSNS